MQYIVMSIYQVFCMMNKCNIKSSKITSGLSTKLNKNNVSYHIYFVININLLSEEITVVFSFIGKYNYKIYVDYN